MREKLTAERLKDALHYDQDTGVFRWKISTNRRIVIGSKAGTVSHGRTQIKLFGVIHRAHRLAWLYVYGEWPRKEIDHINGIATDNRIVNLRDVPRLINAQNQRRPHAKNRTGGMLGVSKSPGRTTFRARIDGEHIGNFCTPQQAHEAYVAAKRQRHAGGTL